MCGPSSAMKSLNSQMTNLATNMAGQAKKVFGTIDSTVQKILSTTGNIIAGGPSQGGMSQSEINARRARNIEAGGAETRNIKGAALSALAATGGGNVSLPSGVAGQVALEATLQGARDTAAAENQLQQENYAIGRDNFWRATDTALKAPSAYATADEFNKSAIAGTAKAQESQQSIDAMKGWWKAPVMKLATGLVGAATGGISSAITKGVSGLFTKAAPAFGGMSAGNISGSFGGPTSATTESASSPWQI